MSLLRNLTTRRQKPDALQISSPLFIGRAASQRGGRPILRSQISSPVALISTSNVMINDADLIAGTTPLELRSVSPSFTSSSSNDDADSSNSSIRSRGGTLTDASSIDEEASSPITSCEPEPNHLSCYFKPAVDTQSPSLSHAASFATRASTASPEIPSRVASHSKKAHENLHRKRSMQRVLSPPPSRDGGRGLGSASSTTFSSAFVEAQTPFVNELAQLDEAAEEFGMVVRDAEAIEDALFMKTFDLAQYSASEYLSDIQEMIYGAFADEEEGVAGSWI